MDVNAIFEKLTQLEKLIVGTSKEILNVEEFAIYTGFSKSKIYKLVRERTVPFYKPNNGPLFFTKSEINEWLLRNKTKSMSQLESEAINYTFKKII